MHCIVSNVKLRSMRKIYWCELEFRHFSLIHNYKYNKHLS